MDRDLLLATCALALPQIAAGEAAPKWVQLLPQGAAGAVDGRAWVVGDPAAILKASKLPAHIDFDHASERPAPDQNTAAAGWIEELSAHGPAGEPGIWGRVEWTPDGAKAIASKQYRFLSPVFMHGKDDGQVKRILRAALTNTPALELKALASIQQQEKQGMDLKAIAAALGLPETATAQDIVKAIAALKNGSTAMATQIEAIAKAAGLDPKKFGDTELVALCTKIKTPAEGGATATALAAAQGQIDELQKQVASLSQKLSGNSAAAEVDKAIAAGKIAPAQKEWAIDYASRNPEGFTAFLKNQPTILPGGRIAKQGGAAEGALSDDEKAMCAQMGIAEDKFLATKKAMAITEAE